jgi:hypothetical protein
MPRSLIPAAPERDPPTLWPSRQNDRTRMELAFEASEQENRMLKNIVISLSETIFNLGERPHPALHYECHRLC